MNGSLISKCFLHSKFFSTNCPNFDSHVPSPWQFSCSNYNIIKYFIEINFETNTRDISFILQQRFDAIHSSFSS